MTTKKFVAVRRSLGGSDEHQLHFPDGTRSSVFTLDQAKTYRFSPTILKRLEGLRPGSEIKIASFSATSDIYVRVHDETHDEEIDELEDAIEELNKKITEKVGDLISQRGKIRKLLDKKKLQRKLTLKL